MKFILPFLLLTGCVTSKMLYERAKMACRFVPKKDAEQLVCIHNYVREICLKSDPDVRICGKAINRE